MNSKLPILFGAVGLALATATPAVSAPLSANAGVTTNYIFRGVTQSGADPAVSAGLDYDLGAVLPGLAVGTWASSINFGDDTPMELDLYGSYTGTIVDKFSYNVGFITYNYPNSPHAVDYNWYEGYVGLSYDFGVAQLAGKVFYSPDYQNLSDTEWYYTGGVTIPIASWLAFSANIGRTELDRPIGTYVKSYTDWNLSLAATFDAYTLTVGYASTDMNGAFKVKSGPFQNNDQVWVSIAFKLM
jgi:uncharacterized protein (TIGR02001 family)